jgi:hypothetical protein
MQDFWSKCSPRVAQTERSITRALLTYTWEGMLKKAPLRHQYLSDSCCMGGESWTR